ncbi:MAG: cell division protein DamX [Kluyvera cryocrescens]|uniref:Cell division protein DamX n=2 Tax=Kluyvera cryocrescens TaxID=580 RepID=A0AAW9C1A4_KLUCR|nr:cell division protein DamX [Kluyvera cryocrescens]MCX2868529.1 cell division protein DamX [Kluyvera cryocrescens]MDU5683967.1 cell division protein DamX [Kluyvera cryocrescens]MDW3776046.1 cell division protein DamX [Kluyvera cryocrescens]MEB6634355.1 cell division protein DamX [Kluyvera cryocrescens]MEB7714292.1 cell division protein DamX [Kluyvera cryocrescens]
MDEFKPEDELKPDPSDRRTGRSRQSSDRDSEPQINFDDVELDADERRPSRSRKAREEAEPEDEYYESDDEDAESADEVVERRPRKRKNAAPRKPASRQYIMMGLGIVVLLVLIVGIGSALKAPSSSSDQSASTEKSISLSGDNADQTATTQPAQGTNPQQDVSLPPISSTPTQGQQAAAPDGQQRVEVQGDLNNALTQQQGQIDNAVVNSTLPTEPATVAPIRNGARPAVTAPETPRQTTAATPRPERKHAVIEAKPQPVATAKTPAATTQSKPVTEAKPVTTAPKATATTTAPTKAPTTTTETAKPAATTAPAATATAATTAPAAAATGKSAGDVNSLKSASGSHYTLQLSSSSNYDNLNGWAKKENLKNYVVYETSRNGQPWYVLVSGIYASKDDAKKAVTTLPADVQAKNPWAKPLRQVQTDLK